MAFDLTGKAVRKLRLPTVNYQSSPKQVVSAQTKDQNSRYVSVTLYDDRGDLDVGTYGTVAFLRATLQDGKPVSSTAEIDAGNNCVNCYLSEAMLKEPGLIECDVKLAVNDTDGEAGDAKAASLTSQTFIVRISDSQTDGEEIDDVYDAAAKALLVLNAADADNLRAIENLEGKINDINSVDIKMLTGESEIADETYVALRDNDINNRHIPVYDAEKKVFVDSGKSADDLVEGAVLLDPTKKGVYEQEIKGRLSVEWDLTAEKLLSKDAFIACNNEGEHDLAGLVFPDGGLYTGTDEDDMRQDAYAIAFDRKTKTLRLGNGTIYRGDGTAFDNFYWGQGQSYIQVDQAIATRADEIADGNIPKWDDTQKTFVNSEISTEELTSKLKDGYSQGLSYYLNDDGNSYTVQGIGTCTDTVLIIPAYHKGKKVTVIDDYAFEGCSITSVLISESISYVGHRAFCDCYKLTKIYYNGNNRGDWDSDWDIKYIDDEGNFYYHTVTSTFFKNLIEVTDAIGDIDAALDAIIALQNSLIGGNA